MPHAIPEDISLRNPLFRPEWMPLYRKMSEHGDAPFWNIKIGDRLTAEDTRIIRDFEENLHTRRSRHEACPSGEIISRIRKAAAGSLYISERIAGIDLKKDFATVRPMERSDVQQRIDTIIPRDADLSRLIVLPTSGTTGEPILVPSDPLANGHYDPLIQYALRRNGLQASYDHHTVAAIQLCAQKKTIVYCACHSYLGGAGFAKINLDPAGWRKDDSVHRYIPGMEPVFLSGDPYAFSEAMRIGISYHPRIMLSSALTLDGFIRSQTEKHFGCPLVDFYSTNETGPIACSIPESPEFLQLIPNDIFVEAVDAGNRPVPPGTEGEILVTGGRNPYLPLLRYRTGDRGIVIYDHKLPDPLPLIKLSQSRRLVVFSTPQGQAVNTLDLAGIARRYPAVRHFQFVQTPDYAVTLKLTGADLDRLVFTGQDELLKEDIVNLFGGNIAVNIDDGLHPELGKQEPFIREM